MTSYPLLVSPFTVRATHYAYLSTYPSGSRTSPGGPATPDCPPVHRLRRQLDF